MVSCYCAPVNVIIWRFHWSGHFHFGAKIILFFQRTHLFSRKMAGHPLDCRFWRISLERNHCLKDIFSVVLTLVASKVAGFPVDLQLRETITLLHTREYPSDYPRTVVLALRHYVIPGVQAALQCGLLEQLLLLFCYCWYHISIVIRFS